MGTLSQGVQQYGTNLQSSPLTLSGSVFAVGTTTVFILDSSGSYKSWQNGRSSFLNTISAIPSYAAFQILPGGAITTNDSQLSFGTTISAGGVAQSTTWAIEARGLDGQLVTGLTPTVGTLKKESDNTALTASITFTETTPGIYRFTFDPVANGEAFLQVDLGFTMAAQNRYVDVFLYNAAKSGSKAYAFTAKDSNGNYLSGITPTVLSFKKESDGSNVTSSLTFTETVAGMYKFYYDAVTNGTALLQLDLGSSSAIDSRIINLQLN